MMQADQQVLEYRAANLRCDCGAEPTVQIDMSAGPGCMCRISCGCGATGNQVWDVTIPWRDLFADWFSDTETALRRAMVLGLVTRDERGRYTLTEAGQAEAERRATNPSIN